MDESVENQELDECGSTVTELEDGLLNEIEGMKDEFLNTKQYLKDVSTRLEEEAATREAAEEQLLEEKDARAVGLQLQRKTEQENIFLKQEVQELEEKLYTTELDRDHKEEQIRCLRTQVPETESAYVKINKEKKDLQDQLERMHEDLESCEERNYSLSKIKIKLEQTLDEMEDEIEQEKKSRGETERSKRKLEGEFKLLQESLYNKDREVHELEVSYVRKEKENKTLGVKLEEEQARASNATKQIRELSARLDLVEEERETERLARIRAETQRVELSRRVEDLTLSLEEAADFNSNQSELGRRREDEIMRVRQEIEQVKTLYETQIETLKKKHSETLNCILEETESGNKLRLKLECESQKLKTENHELRTLLDTAYRDNKTMERTYKDDNSNLQKYIQQLDESRKFTAELEMIKKRLGSEKIELQRQLTETQNALGQSMKLKSGLQFQVEELKKSLNDEAKEKSTLNSKHKNLFLKFNHHKKQMEEVLDAKDNISRRLSQSQAELDLCKTKYETETVHKVEDLEVQLSRAQNKISESESQILVLENKLVNSDKMRRRCLEDSQELQDKIETLTFTNTNLEKKLRQLERVSGEWKSKYDGVMMNLEELREHEKTLSLDLLRVKSNLETLQEKIEFLKKDNRGLLAENKELLEKFEEEGRRVAESEKTRRRLEKEKHEVENTLEEAEATIEQHEHRNLRCQLEMSKLKQELEQQLLEKEEEMSAFSKSYQRTIDSIQANLDCENKSKIESLKAKKKLESDLQEAEMSLDHVNRHNTELSQGIRKLQSRNHELEQNLENEIRNKKDAQSIAISAERKVGNLMTELEETRTLLENSERGKKIAETELQEVQSGLTALNIEHETLHNNRRKLETDYNNIMAEMEEFQNAVKLSEEKCRKLVEDKMRLSDELKQEKERSEKEENQRRSLEVLLKDAVTKAEEAESSSSRGGRRVIDGLEQRIQQLQEELDLEQTKVGEALRNYRRSERHCKELNLKQEEDKENYSKLQELIERLEKKVRMYKHQAEQAEERAITHLSKLRKVEMEMEKIDEKAASSDQVLRKYRRQTVPSNMM